MTNDSGTLGGFRESIVRYRQGVSRFKREPHWDPVVRGQVDGI